MPISVGSQACWHSQPVTGARCAASRPTWCTESDLSGAGATQATRHDRTEEFEEDIERSDLVAANDDHVQASVVRLLSTRA